MCDKNNKEKLYYLFDKYLNAEINTSIFCFEYHNAYVIEVNGDELTSLEHCIFEKLRVVTGRYNEDTSDIPENLKYFFYTGDEVRILVKKAKESLDSKKDLLPDFENEFEKIKV